jgi:Tol biopolymer transport system component/DNA-binding winged helix-turn-helix (wHTH) protein
MSNRINQIYEFGDFQLNPAERLLLRQGQPVSITPKAFDTLLALVQQSGHVLEKDELLKQVWADTAVEEVNLARNIWTLRKALGDDNGEHRYIQTVPRVGYRFVTPVTVSQNESAGLFIQRRMTARIVSEEMEISEPPHSEIAVREKHLLPAIRARHAGRWIALGVFVLVALTTTIILGWGRLHAKPPAKLAAGPRFLTDGQHNDDAPYWGSDGEIYFLRQLSNTTYESWRMNADGTNQRRANSEIKSLLAGRWSPDGKKVIFRKEDNPQNVYLADADGANEVLLPFPIGQGDWSPDSSQYVDEVRTGKDSGQIFLIDIKTRRNIALTDNHSLNADPSFSPDGKQIVFASNRDKNANIYVMQTDGSNVRRLTDDQFFDNFPVFSPDGTQIAFQSNREEEHTEVYLKNLNDDTAPRRLTHSSEGAGLRPKAWSPDGTQILLIMSQNSKDRIVLADVDPPATPLLNDEAADLFFPRLSADGKTILYVARMADQRLELRWTDLVTKRTRTVYQTVADPVANHLEADWSPDNSLIAFSTRVNGNSDIFSIKPDGNGLKNLTNNPLPDSSPIFSPDGSEIIFVRDDYGKTQLYRMDLNGGNQRRVSNKDGYEMMPSVSPDGAYLAFSGDRQGHGLDIFLLSMKNPDDEKIIASRRFHDSSPVFSPDGKRMAFIASSDGNAEIYLVNSDGTGLFRLTHTRAAEMTPQFSGDGHSLFYAANRGDRFAIYELALP